MKFEIVKKQLFAIVALSVLLQVPASADCADGIRLYNQRQYAAADAAFKSCTIRDANTAYYAALTAQQCRENERAKHLYQQIVGMNPNSPAAKLALTALKNMEGPPEQANLPRETWVPFNRVGSHIAVDAQLNRQPVKMVFDTGADITLFSEGMLKEIGISIPDRAPDGYGGGIGKAGMTPMWKVLVDLKLGSIERKNFRVMMTKVPQVVALLGRDFYQGFEYSINDANNTLGFKRIGSGSSTSTSSAKTPKAAPVGPEGSTTVGPDGKYVYNVPYTGTDTQIIVEAKINGTPCKMIFDTGAGSCYFTAEQAAAAGIQVGADAKQIPIQGVGGGSTASLTRISSFRLGTIEEKDVVAAVGGKSVAKYPLLGQTFIRDYQYSIDSANKVIHFSRH
ncbi:MAG TPA: retroviral-like aspartic protease family protein [Drouetiella sp.]